MTLALLLVDPKGFEPSTSRMRNESKAMLCIDF